MNIQMAKDQVKKTVSVYLMKDEDGRYRIPVERQRPVFLIGAPGIGKTAIMAQIAQEMDIGLVSYSMTHHTRQSALGLPFIASKIYGGQEYNVSEYTMSEIIASVYECMEKSGKKEGILFLDEINCVSETLGPSMLQFLQYKTFGPHRVPEGWVVVTAGNPPEYNRSVHEFDIATLDRLKVIEAEPDYPVWKAYASEAGVHRAIRTYLDLKPDDFYGIETTIDGKNYVTARGWEDLSDAMKLYEEKGYEIDEMLISQYIHNSRIAGAFASYYRLFHRYRSEYRIGEIVVGWGDPDGPDRKTRREIASRAAAAPFDGRVTLMGLLIDSVMSEIRETVLEEDCLRELHGRLRELRKRAEGKHAEEVIRILSEDMEGQKEIMKMEAASGGLSRHQRRKMTYPVRFEEACAGVLREQMNPDQTDGFQVVRARFAAEAEAVQKKTAQINARISHIFRFTADAFGTGNEMLLLVTELTVSDDSAEFLNRHANEEYFRYNRQFLLSERENEIDAKLKKRMQAAGAGRKAD